MAKSDCNVFLPIHEEEEDPWTLATCVDGDDELEYLGRDLWFASKRYGMQSKLAADLGGALADIGPDGRFEHWLNNGSYMDDEFLGRLLRHAGRKGSVASHGDLTRKWAGELEDGRVFKELQAFLDKVPPRGRAVRKLGLGEKESHVLPGPLPALGDLFGGRSKVVVPILVGAESAELLAGMLADVDLSREKFQREQAIDKRAMFMPSYLFAQGRWLTPMMSAKAKRPMVLAGAEMAVAWIPVSQALAICPTANGGGFTEGEAGHLDEAIAEKDREDLMSIAKAVDPKIFFEGSKLARAWFDRVDAESQIELAAWPGSEPRKVPSL